MDKKYRSMCGQCYNALEALMITHKNQHNSVLEVDSLVFLAQSLMGAHTP